jgi:hypothetical protein
MRRYSSPRGPTLVFVATFATLVGFGFLGMRHVPSLGFAHQEVPAVRSTGPWYPVFLRGGMQLDHTILWNDIDSAIDNARNADVLFVGSSHVQFALRPHEVGAFEKQTGLSAYSIAVPVGGYEFPLALIEKFDLRPRIVVVELNLFAGEAETREGQRVRDAGRWNGLTTVWEERLAGRVWPTASRILPTFATPRWERALLRSTEDGTWRSLNWPHRHITIDSAQRLVAWRTRWVREFHAALAARGIGLVLTCMPTGGLRCDPFAVQPMATALNVPAIVPRVRGPLWTTDFAHMCPLSGKRFGRALLRDLGRLDAVRAIARERRALRIARGRALEGPRPVAGR